MFHGGMVHVIARVLLAVAAIVAVQSDARQIRSRLAYRRGPA
jgi:hypothetical protein